MKHFQIAFSNKPSRNVEATDVRDALRRIDKDFDRNTVVGVAGARGGNPKFFMKRDDGDTAWPISAATAATFAPIGTGRTA